MASLDQKIDDLIGKIVAGTATESERMQYDLLTLEMMRAPASSLSRPSEQERDRFDALVEKYSAAS